MKTYVFNVTLSFYRKFDSKKITYTKTKSVKAYNVSQAISNVKELYKYSDIRIESITNIYTE